MCCTLPADKNWQFFEVFCFGKENEDVQIQILDIDITSYPSYSTLQKCIGMLVLYKFNVVKC